MSSKFLFLFLTFSLIVTCCTFDADLSAGTKSKVLIHQKVVHQHREKQKQFIQKSLPGFFTEVFFAEGGDLLEKEARVKIKELFDRARRMGKIQTVKVISWADSTSAEIHKSSMQRIVDNRNDNLEMYLEGLDYYLDVRKINMIESSIVSEGLLSQDDQLLKNHFSQRVASNDSKSVVMFFLEK